MRESMDVNAMSLPDAYAAFGETGLIRRVLELARDEDLGSRGDITSRVCGGDKRGGGRVSAVVRAREACVLAGLGAIVDLIEVFGADVEVELISADGRPAAEGEDVAVVRGAGEDVLTLERTMLNLVGRLSGVATMTRRFVDAAAGGTRSVDVLDTRKTTPGLRVLEKYAVLCGGGRCHRLGLHDAVLIKDNHLAGIGIGELGEFIAGAARQARAEGPIAFVEVEVDSLEQLDVVLGLGEGVVDIVLLDNMGAEMLREAVARRLRVGGSGAAIRLEASGGVSLETIGEIAQTGVDRISVGALTRDARTVDFGLDVE